MPKDATPTAEKFQDYSLAEIYRVAPILYLDDNEREAVIAEEVAYRVNDLVNAITDLALSRARGEADGTRLVDIGTMMGRLGVGDLVSSLITNADLGSRVREARKLRGWNQTALAEEIGVSASAVSRIETGKRLPSPKVLYKLNEALGFTGESSPEAGHS